MLSTQLVALETEKAELLQSLSAVEAELAIQGEELQRVQSTLVTERESGVKAAEVLQNQLNEKVPNRESISLRMARLNLSSCIAVHRKAGSRHWRARWRKLVGPVFRELWRRHRR